MTVLHEHCPQLQKVIVFWVLHLHDTPRIEAASDLLAFGFYQLIGSNHRERDTGLERDIQGWQAPHRDCHLHRKHTSINRGGTLLLPQDYLESLWCTFYLEVAGIFHRTNCTNKLNLQLRFLSLTATVRSQYPDNFSKSSSRIWFSINSSHLNADSRKQELVMLCTWNSYLEKSGLLFKIFIFIWFCIR